MFRPLALSAIAVLLLFAPALPSLGETKVIIKVKQPQEEDAITKPAFEGKRASVDIAILLDTSNSMDGLINQAKSQLWSIVQQFAKAEKNGQTPSLRVALFEYGNTSLPAKEGYIRQVVPLTNDLDKLSEALFALTTQGGDEYCGQVIDEAVTRLDWSEKPNGYKAIFIAGNEPFTQGPIDYSKACKRAIEKGIVVNTIHCGSNEQGIQGKWQHGAQLAEGDSLNIDQDRVVASIPCPQDKIIIELNTELNGTYLWYGSQIMRTKCMENQTDQDKNAAVQCPSSLITRGAIKSSGVYDNTGRDLVDTFKKDKDLLKNLKEEELPEAMQKMTADEREKHIAEMTKKRDEIAKKIQALSKEREAYLAKEREKLAEENEKSTLGDAVIASVKKQLTRSGFTTN